MSEVNKRIFDTIEKAPFSSEVKELLKVLLDIELRNSATQNPLYGQDYDRAIKKISGINPE
ncbi:MAG: hypothetical protein ACOWW1_05495 [archaeon]